MAKVVVASCARSVIACSRRATATAAEAIFCVCERCNTKKASHITFRERAIATGKERVGRRTRTLTKPVTLSLLVPNAGTKGDVFVLTEEQRHELQQIHEVIELSQAAADQISKSRGHN